MSGTAPLAAYCLVLLYLQISKRFINVQTSKPLSPGNKTVSSYCTYRETCPKMKAVLEVRPELTQPYGTTQKSSLEYLHEPTQLCHHPPCSPSTTTWLESPAVSSTEICSILPSKPQCSSFIFQFSHFGLKKKKAPALRFQLCGTLFKGNGTKNHRALKRTK